MRRCNGCCISQSVVKRYRPSVVTLPRVLPPLAKNVAAVAARMAMGLRRMRLIPTNPCLFMDDNFVALSSTTSDFRTNVQYSSSANGSSFLTISAELLRCHQGGVFFLSHANAFFDVHPGEQVATDDKESDQTENGGATGAKDTHCQGKEQRAEDG